MLKRHVIAVRERLKGFDLLKDRKEGRCYSDKPIKVIDRYEK